MGNTYIIDRDVYVAQVTDTVLISKYINIAGGFIHNNWNKSH